MDRTTQLTLTSLMVLTALTCQAGALDYPDNNDQYGQVKFSAPPERSVDKVSRPHLLLQLGPSYQSTVIDDKSSKYKIGYMASIGLTFKNKLGLRADFFHQTNKQNSFDYKYWGVNTTINSVMSLTKRFQFSPFAGLAVRHNDYASYTTKPSAIKTALGPTVGFRGVYQLLSSRCAQNLAITSQLGFASLRTNDTIKHSYQELHAAVGLRFNNQTRLERDMGYFVEVGYQSYTILDLATTSSQTLDNAGAYIKLGATFAT